MTPSYRTPGRILVQVEPPSGAYKHDYTVHDFDPDTCVWYINEGTGFDWWLDQHCTFPEPGTYVIQDITGRYIRGDSMTYDDDEEWSYGFIRVATWLEKSTEALDFP